MINCGWTKIKILFTAFLEAHACVFNHYFYELFLSQNSILWNRVYSIDLGPKSQIIAEKNLDKILKIYDAEHMVIGHTPQENGIKKRFNGKILCIDTGMSEAFGNKNKKTDRIHYLEIIERKDKRQIIMK